MGKQVKCGSTKTKTGKRCQNPAMIGYSRCQLHRGRDIQALFLPGQASSDEPGEHTTAFLFQGLFECRISLTLVCLLYTSPSPRD